MNLILMIANKYFNILEQWKRENFSPMWACSTIAESILLFFNLKTIEGGTNNMDETF